MNTSENGNVSNAPELVKKEGKEVKRAYVSSGDSLEAVIKMDDEGIDLIFESDKGKFMRLTEADIKRLSPQNRRSYFVSKALNDKHDPENDELQRRIKITSANERRKLYERTVSTTSQNARATKKLQAFVGEGYEPYWCRPDKLEDKLEKGYEIVRPADDISTGISKLKAEGGSDDGNHFETRVRQGETETVLLRISSEKKKKLEAEQHAAADRLVSTSDRAGKSRIRELGGEDVSDSRVNWQDRQYK